MSPPQNILTAKNHFERPYIEGDIQLRQYCSDGGSGIDCLKRGGETNKRPPFKGSLMTSSYNVATCQKCITAND